MENRHGSRPFYRPPMQEIRPPMQEIGTDKVRNSSVPQSGLPDPSRYTFVSMENHHRSGPFYRPPVQKIRPPMQEIGTDKSMENHHISGPFYRPPVQEIRPPMQEIGTDKVRNSDVSQSGLPDQDRNTFEIMENHHRSGPFYRPSVQEIRPPMQEIGTHKISNPGVPQSRLLDPARYTFKNMKNCHRNGPFYRPPMQEIRPPMQVIGTHKISGSFPQVRKALLAVSTCLQDNPRPDTHNIPMGRPFGPPGSGPGCPPGMDPHSQRSYLPPHIPDYHTRNYPNNAGAPGPRFFFEQEIVFRMIILNEMVGSIIGKGGSTIRALQSETGACIKILELVADSDERVVAISARENSDMMHSPAQDAVVRVYSRISEASMDRSSPTPARLLVPSQHIGCLLGKGGSIITEMRKITGASIRIFGNEQIPRCAQRNDEMVQVTGSFQSIQDALLHITGRIRDVILPKPHPSGGMPPYPPVGNIPVHQSRQEPPPPHLHPSGGMPPYPMHSFRPDAPMGHFETGDHRPPPVHSMEYMGADRMPYSYGGEQGGPRPFLEQPSPRTWPPEAPRTNSEAPRNMPDAVLATDLRKGPVASENQVATPTSTTTEVVIPCKYIGFVCGNSGSEIEEIRQMSGASITVHDPKPGDTNSIVVICGDPEQTKKAQSLIHAFIFCGLQT